jgi:hypothetical protein
VEDLLSAVPTDDTVLHTLAYVLRPAGRLGDLTAAYERAVAKAPPGEELLVGLFGCHVRWATATAAGRAHTAPSPARGAARDGPQRLGLLSATAAGPSVALQAQRSGGLCTQRNQGWRPAAGMAVPSTAAGTPLELTAAQLRALQLGYAADVASPHERDALLLPPATLGPPPGTSIS